MIPSHGASRPLEAAGAIERRELARDLPPEERRCRLCIEGKPARSIDTCEACMRQKFRCKGLTKCCNVLPLMAVRVRYCPACPGDGKVGPITLVSPDGEELPSWHPLGAIVGNLPLSRVLELRRVAPSELVLSIKTVRSWALRRLDTAKRDQYVRVEFTCDDCKKPSRRYVTMMQRGSVRLCLACKRKHMLEDQRKQHAAYRARRPIVPCANCQLPCKVEAYGCCPACCRRRRENGTCACGKIRVRARRGKPACPECDPFRAQRGAPCVDVVVTDGTLERIEQVGTRVLLGSGSFRPTAGAWIAPVVLVERIRSRRSHLKDRPVISGIAVPDTSSATRAFLPLLEGAQSEDEVRKVLKRELADQRSVGSALADLRRAGLLGYDWRLTERARAIMRWCESAGVKL